MKALPYCRLCFTAVVWYLVLAKFSIVLYPMQLHWLYRSCLGYKAAENLVPLLQSFKNTFHLIEGVYYRLMKLLLEVVETFWIKMASFEKKIHNSYFQTSPCVSHWKLKNKIREVVLGSWGKLFVPPLLIWFCSFHFFNGRWNNEGKYAGVGGGEKNGERVGEQRKTQTEHFLNQTFFW